MKYILYTLTLFSLSWAVVPEKAVVHIYKAQRKLYILKGKDTLCNYKMVLGTNPVGDKMQEGDRKTPEGSFKLKSKYPHNTWNYFLWIDYPNAESYRKFNERKRKHIIPQDAKIGGEVGIHGVPEDCDYLIDKGKDWTWGCISLKNEQVKRVYELCAVGSGIIIYK